MKMNSPKLTSPEMCRYVAQQCSLSKDQVEECFKTFSNIIISLSENEDRPSNLVLIFPYLGWFEFKHKKGNAKGTSKVIPNRKGEAVKKIVLEEDDPDYDRIFFHVKKNVQRIVRESSSRKYIKEKNGFHGLDNNE